MGYFCNFVFVFLLKKEEKEERGGRKGKEIGTDVYLSR